MFLHLHRRSARVQLSVFLDVDPQPASGGYSAALAEALQHAPAKLSYRKRSRKRQRSSRAAEAAPSASVATAIRLLRDEMPAVASGVLEVPSGGVNAATRTRRTWRNSDAMEQLLGSDEIAVASTLALAFRYLQPPLHAAAARTHFCDSPSEWMLDTRASGACSRLLELLPREQNVTRVAVVANPLERNG